ncbi:MAG: hypothetical protein IAF58_05085 [Leptolyngbya sp.]|nr:hypothetical protein [Candidatus Melainabacteria bacterium]
MPDKKDNGEECDYLHPENCDQESQEKKDLAATKKEVEKEAKEALDQRVESK